MRMRLFKREHTYTKSVQLDTSKCQACWKCISDCKNNVIDKVDLPWHKHSLIIQPENCTGCLKCVKNCEHNAFSKIDKTRLNAEKLRKSNMQKFVMNNLLLIVGIIMAISGLLLQFGYHFGNDRGGHGQTQTQQAQTLNYEQARHLDTSKTILGLDYYDWSTTHKYSIVCFSLLMIYHIVTHWKWYKGVILKRLFKKNHQVLTFSLIFLLVATTGLVPWFIDLSGGESLLRTLFIELHDKIALILCIYFILHILQRNKWYLATFKKLINLKKNEQAITSENPAQLSNN